MVRMSHLTNLTNMRLKSERKLGYKWLELSHLLMLIFTPALALSKSNKQIKIEHVLLTINTIFLTESVPFPTLPDVIDGKKYYLYIRFPSGQNKLYNLV